MNAKKSARTRHPSIPARSTIDELQTVDAQPRQKPVDPISEALDLYQKLVDAGEAVPITEFCRYFPDIAGILRYQLLLDHAISERLPELLELLHNSWPRAGDMFLDFRLVEELGRGGLSRVFLAEELRLGDRIVVVKVCLRGDHEASILGKLKHDSIVSVHSIQSAADVDLSAICMPFLGRTTLRGALALAWRSGKPPTKASEVLVPLQDGVDVETIVEMPVTRLLRTGSYEEAILYIGQKVAEGLAHAHGLGILHLDLKPSNVLMANGRCPKILDFNLALKRDDILTRLGGTVPYMSPEQAQCSLGNADANVLDERSDIFSLGVMLYEMLSHRLPFGLGPRDVVAERSASGEALAQAMNGLAEAGTSRRLIAIIERCLAPDPRNRYQSAAELEVALKRELSVGRRLLRSVRSHRRPVSAAVVSGTVLLGLALTLLAMRPPYSVRQYDEGIACFSAMKYEQAIEHFSRSLDGQGGQPEAFYHRARAYVELTDYHRAIRDLQAVLELSSGEDGKAHALLGYCLNSIESHAVATSCYDRAINCGYRSTAVLNNLGVSHHLRGRHSSAIKALDEAYELGGWRDVVLRNRAAVWHRVAEAQACYPHEAIRDATSLLQLDDNDAGDYELAAKVYGYASSLDPRNEMDTIEYVKTALAGGMQPEAAKSNQYLRGLCERSGVDLSDGRAQKDVAAVGRSRFLLPSE